MAWNEPGNNNGNNGRDNDPWGNNNNRGDKGGREQGPPDLDEVFNKLSQKLGGKFGNKGGSGKGPSFSGGGAIGFGVIAVIAIAIWFFAGFYTISEAERGVVLRLGKYDRIVDPGLNWRPRFIDEVTPVNIQAIRSMRASGLMLTKDENVVTVAMDVQYRVADPFKYLYRVTNADDSLRQATDSALRAVIGDSLMDSILTSGRQQIRQSTQETLNQVIDSYDMGLMIVDVNFQSARPPEQVKDAFDDAIAAREDEERFIREAEAYSMYLDTMEEVYSNTSKVLIDSESSGNLLYLPMDKLVGQQTTPTKRSDKSSATYDHIELESQRTATDNETDTQNRSTTSRQGRY